MHGEPIATPLPMPRHYEQPSDERRLQWAEVHARLDEAEHYWLATTQASGAPHVTPVWGIWIGDTLYFSGIPTAAWARNIARDPRASVHLESATNVLIVDGVVEDAPSIGDPALAAAIVDRWHGKYGRLEPDPAADGMYCLRARQIRGWSEFPHDATRFTFPDRA
jgi:hypothetical protein